MEAWIVAQDQVAPIDIVIANAGISAGTSGKGESTEQVEMIFDVNVQGVFHTFIHY